MAVRIAVAPGELVLSGDLTARTASDLRAAVYAALDAGVGDLVVDLRSVDAVDATGLGLLVSAHRRAGRQGRRLVLRNVPASLDRLLTATRLRRILAVEAASA